MVDDHAAIAVLGPDHEASDAILEAARAVGEALARAGYAVVVQGGGDVAGAAGRGARIHEGRLLEVVEGPNEAAAPVRVSDRVMRMARPTVFSRLEAVLDHADALVALPGDLTALAALCQVWSYGSTPDRPYRPLILLGDAWPGIVKVLADAAGLDRRQRAMVTFAAAPDEAVETLRYYIVPTP